MPAGRLARLGATPDFHHGLLALFGAQEVITDIRVHGNAVTTTQEILEIAGVEKGAPFKPEIVDEAARRLRASKQFETVEVLKRFASIDDPSQVVIVIVVDEGPLKIERTGDPARPTRVVRGGGGANLMVLPVLRVEDGYGVTYGARLARPDVAGAGSRLSFALTWGGEKRVAAELDKEFVRRTSGTTTAVVPLIHVGLGASLTRRTHPYFGEHDDRARVYVSADREIVRPLRVGASAGVQHVSFMGAEDRFAHIGGELTVDTRLDQFLARNALFGKASWERLDFRGGNGVTRSSLEGRGYLGLFGQSVLVVRALRDDSDKPLPPYLEPMLGGLANLRGFRAGSAVGDTLVAGSAELRVPLTSPLSFGKAGVSAFVDAATVYDKGEILENHPFKQGYGGTLWFSAAVVQFGVTVAHGRGASTRVHFGGAVAF